MTIETATAPTAAWTVRSVTAATATAAASSSLLICCCCSRMVVEAVPSVIRVQ